MRSTAALALLCLELTACHGCRESAGSNATSTALANQAPPASSLTRTDFLTTSPELALGSLDGRITQLEGHVKERPKDIGMRASLASALRQRAQIGASPADLERVWELAESAIKDQPESSDAKEFHIRALSATHHFAQALAELDALIEAHKGEPPFAEDHSAQRGSILQALGRYDEALPLLRHEREQNPSPLNLDLEGVLLGLMGKVNEAEKNFVLAEEKNRDPSPFFLTALYFDRASLWEREGVLDRATDIYRAAHERLPQHVHVATHLAALLPPKDAVAILEPLGHEDGDPEVLAQLGVFRDMVKDGSGKAALESAKAHYTELMKTLPEAYADHAGWFWLGAGGDPDKAFEAATVNLGARETAESFELYLATAAASHHHDEACRVASKARAFPYPSHRLTEQLRQLGDCGPAPSASASASAGASASAAPPASAAPSASAKAGSGPAPKTSSATKKP